MTRRQLHATVARVTNESLAVVNRLGFGLIDDATVTDRNDSPLRALDCPCCGGTIVLAWDSDEELPPLADCRRCGNEYEYHDDEVYETSLDHVELSPARSYAPAA